MIFGQAQAIAREPTGRDFFAGETITLIVGYGPESNYASYARLVGKHLQNHLPDTKVIVRYVPGAGSLIAANKLYHAAADGLTIGSFNTGMIYAQLFRLEGVKFDLGKMDWIGKAARDPRTIVIGAKSGLRSIEDVKEGTDQVVIVGGNKSSAQHHELSALYELLGLRGRLVWNFTGAERRLGLISGDFDVTYGTYSSFRRIVDDDHAFFAAQLGAREGGVGSDIPAIVDYISDPTDLEVVSLMTDISFLGRMMTAPPGVPEDRLAALREAYDAALNDPELRAEADALKISIDPADGETVDRVVQSLLNPPPSAFYRFASIVGRGDVPLKLNVRVLGVDPSRATVQVESAGGHTSTHALAENGEIELSRSSATLAEFVPGDTCTATLTLDKSIEIAAMMCDR